MARDLHTTSLISGSDLLAFEDRLHVGKFTVAYGAGASAGASSTASVAAPIPPGAVLLVGQVAGVQLSAVASATGFTLTATPNTGTLAAGSATVLVVA